MIVGRPPFPLFPVGCAPEQGQQFSSESAAACLRAAAVSKTFQLFYVFSRPVLTEVKLCRTGLSHMSHVCLVFYIILSLHPLYVCGSTPKKKKKDIFPLQDVSGDSII